MVCLRTVSREATACQYAAAGHGFESMTPQKVYSMSFFIICTIQLAYVLIVYIHLILRCGMSQEDWSRGYSVPVRWQGSCHRGRTTASLFFNFSVRHSHFFVFLTVIFSIQKSTRKVGPTLFAFLQAIQYLILGLNHHFY